MTKSYAGPSLVGPPCLPGKLEDEIIGLQSSLEVPGKKETQFCKLSLFTLCFGLKEGWEGGRDTFIYVWGTLGTCMELHISYKHFSFAMLAIQGWENVRDPRLSRWPPLEVLGNATCNLKTKPPSLSKNSQQFNYTTKYFSPRRLQVAVLNNRAAFF